MNGEDFVEIMSYCMAAGLLSFEDMNKSEIMVRDQISLNESKILSTNVTDNRAVPINRADVYDMQFNVFSKENWRNPETWLERIKDIHNSNNRSN